MLLSLLKEGVQQAMKYDYTRPDGYLDCGCFNMNTKLVMYCIVLPCILWCIGFMLVYFLCFRKPYKAEKKAVADDDEAEEEAGDAEAGAAGEP